MKTAVKLFFVVTVLLGMQACFGKKEKKADTANESLGAIEVEIPEALQENEEVVLFIQDMSKAVDEFAHTVDRFYMEAGDLMGKEVEELSMMDKMKLMKVSGQAMLETTRIMESYGGYLEQKDSLMNNLSEEDILALETVWLRFEKRMEQIEEKYQDMMDTQTGGEEALPVAVEE